jgi:hypothetical protein
MSSGGSTKPHLWPKPYIAIDGELRSQVDGVGYDIDRIARDDEGNTVAVDITFFYHHPGSGKILSSTGGSFTENEFAWFVEQVKQETGWQ